MIYSITITPEVVLHEHFKRVAFVLLQFISFSSLLSLITGLFNRYFSSKSLFYCEVEVYTIYEMAVFCKSLVYDFSLCQYIILKTLYSYHISRSKLPSSSILRPVLDRRINHPSLYPQISATYRETEWIKTYQKKVYLNNAKMRDFIKGRSWFTSKSLLSLLHLIDGL